MHYFEPDTFSGHPLYEFTALSQDDVMKLILSSKSKSCELDPIPSFLLKYSVNEILPIIHDAGAPLELLTSFSIFFWLSMYDMIVNNQMLNAIKCTQSGSPRATCVCFGQ